MVDDLEKKLLAGAAYRIFVEELAKHLDATQTLFITTDWSREQLMEASARFHTIRGGAGFFKLSDLASLAGELEKRLLEIEPADLAPQVETLRQLDRQLREIASTIPAPAKT